MSTKFYLCRHCGNVITKLVDSKISVVCCGEQMEELVPNKEGKSGEKFLPVVTQVDDTTIKIDVGSKAHAQLPEHSEAFVYVETENGGITVFLKEKPEIEICTCCSMPIAVYAYSKQHGLWMVEM